MSDASQGPTRSRSREHGGVLMEVGLCVPLALVILLGIIDFGRVWTLANTTAHAAQIGAQFGVQSPNHAADETGIRTTVLQALRSSVAIAANDEGDGMTLEDFTVESERFCECADGTTIDCTNKCGGGTSPAVYVRVRVDTTFETLFDYRAIPSEVPIRRVAVMRAR